jgi:hypothetical protein
VTLASGSASRTSLELGRREPLGGGEIAQAGILNIVAIALALVAWYGCSGVARPKQQLPWVCLGIGAIVLTGVANGVILLTARRTVTQRQGTIFRALETAFTSPAFAASCTSVSDVNVVSIAGLQNFHRAGCALLDGRRDLTVAPRDVQRAAGRQPCGWCEP